MKSSCTTFWKLRSQTGPQWLQAGKSTFNNSTQVSLWHPSPPSVVFTFSKKANLSLEMRPHKGRIFKKHEGNYRQQWSALFLGSLPLFSGLVVLLSRVEKPATGGGGASEDICCWSYLISSYRHFVIVQEVITTTFLNNAEWMTTV
jgi:hypothetical protein